MERQQNIAFLGAGAMGWAIAWIIATRQRGTVTVWDRTPDLIEEARATGKNTKNSIPEIVMPQEVLYYTGEEGLKKTIAGSDLVVLGVPSFAVREMAEKMSGLALPPILMISKGMEAETSLLPFQIVEEVLGKKDILHVTGAGYGKEVHKKMPVTETLASRNTELLKEVQRLLQTEWLTVEISTDLLGVQLAGALKNVLVIGIGMALGEREDSQTTAKLIDQGVQEMTALGRRLGAQEQTFQGPAGRGDLELSADPASRNYKLGQALAQKGLREVQKDLIARRVTVEGFRTAKAVRRLSGDLELPILQGVYRVIYEQRDPELNARELIELLAA